MLVYMTDPAGRVECHWWWGADTRWLANRTRYAHYQCTCLHACKFILTTLCSPLYIQTYSNRRYELDR